MWLDGNDNVIDGNCDDRKHMYLIVVKMVIMTALLTMIGVLDCECDDQKNVIRW